MKSSCWKYPRKGELPELNTTVLVFTGGRRFGAYELGALVENAEGEISWRIEWREDEYLMPNSWCYLPDAPDFMECI